MRFGKRKKNGDLKEKQIIVEEQEAQKEEDSSLLATKESKTAVDRAISGADTLLKQAAEQSLKEVKILEEGRCPECGRKVRQFLFTSICPFCGWSSYISPKKGKMIIHLNSGRTVECDSALDAKGDYVLCVTDDVVRCRVPVDRIEYIENTWPEEEIEERRQDLERETKVVCDWCSKTQQRGDMIPIYVAFGMDQDRLYFCSHPCKERFAKQYPARIHRDCYNRDCNVCDECVQRFLVPPPGNLSYIEEEKG